MTSPHNVNKNKRAVDGVKFEFANYNRLQMNRRRRTATVNELDVVKSKQSPNNPVAVTGRKRSLKKCSTNSDSGVCSIVLSVWATLIRNSIISVTY